MQWCERRVLCAQNTPTVVFVVLVLAAEKPGLFLIHILLARMSHMLGLAVLQLQYCLVRYALLMLFIWCVYGIVACGQALCLGASTGYQNEPCMIMMLCN